MTAWRDSEYIHVVLKWDDTYGIDFKNSQLLLIFLYNVNTSGYFVWQLTARVSQT